MESHSFQMMKSIGSEEAKQDEESQQNSRIHIRNDD